MALRVWLGEALASESPAVRAAAVEALGRATASPAVLAAIAASSTPGNVRLRLRPVLAALSLASLGSPCAAGRVWQSSCSCKELAGDCQTACQPRECHAGGAVGSLN